MVSDPYAVHEMIALNSQIHELYDGETFSAEHSDRLVISKLKQRLKECLDKKDVIIYTIGMQCDDFSFLVNQLAQRFEYDSSTEFNWVFITNMYDQWYSAMQEKYEAIMRSQYSSTTSSLENSDYSTDEYVNLEEDTPLIQFETDGEEGN